MAKVMDMDDFQAENDLHHLTKAREVKNSPGRLKAVAKLHKKRLKEMKGVKEELQEEMGETSRPSINSKSY